MHSSFAPILRRRCAPLFALAVAIACADNLSTSAACPALCPGQAITLRDTILDAIVVDSSLSGFPAIGQEGLLIVSTRGDTFDTRGILRFDSLPTRFFRKNVPTDSAITAVDSAFLTLQIDTSGTRPTAPVTVTLFDVDTSTTIDTTASVLLSLFRPDRVLGSRTFAPDSLIDSIKVPISSPRLLAKITANARLRIGVQVTGTRHAELRIGTSNNFRPADVTFNPVAHGDTVGVISVSALLNSTTPVGTATRTDLEDFLIVARGPHPPNNQILAVGGMPASRVYFQFNLPSSIVDSSTVVRATLLLTQVANPNSPDPHDSADVYPLVVLASEDVTDISRALELVSAPGSLGLDTLQRYTPADTGLRKIEMVLLVRSWETHLTTAAPRAIALQASTEGLGGAQFWFYSSRAPAAVRPRIRITYTPRVPAGSP
jgi:hypothetical protein